MKKLWLIFLLFPLVSGAQVSDDFSDGDFTVNPSWTGDTGHFKISSSTAIPEGQRPGLQLDAPLAGQSCLSVTGSFSGDLEWHFWLKISLNTSAGNFTRIYLLSDQSDLKSPLNGYLLQFGGNADSVWFCRQDSAEILPLFRLDSLFTGNSTNTFRFRVTRSAAGHWEFFSDPAGGTNLSLNGSYFEGSHAGGGYFGLFCQYTSSNLTKFYFDDLYAGPLVVDSLPPSLEFVEVINAAEVRLHFDEPVAPESAENLLNYELSPGPGRPYEAIRMLDPWVVSLFFEPELVSGTDYVLVIKNIEDESGNISGEISLGFNYYIPLPYDVFISEIMADPSPAVGLPEYEYLELYNRSPYPVNMNNWSLIISSTTHVLSDLTLGPGECLVMTDEEGVFSFGPFINVAGLPSFSLPNAGAGMSLKDKGGSTICHVSYQDTWYGDADKSGGGWALEMLSPENPCLTGKNWGASLDPSGGTPGRLGQPVPAMEDELRIDHICFHDPRELEVFFTQSVDSLSASDPSLYRIGPASTIPVGAFPQPPGFGSVRLMLEDDLSAGPVYQLEVAAGLCNCTREETSTTVGAAFALPDSCMPFDIILNEILFNPLGDGVDYVEIYNRSAKAIDLEGIYLASVGETPPNPPDTDLVALGEVCRMLLPGEFLLVSADQEKVKKQYHTENPGAFLDLNSMPAYNNDEGFCLLLDTRTMVIDGFHYREDMHHPLLNTYDGVALERINPDRAGDEPDNWHSASEMSGFGTPGYQNSQYLGEWEAAGSLSVYPEIFSPDGDGHNDQLGIGYSFESPGITATILLFNAEGRKVRTLVSNGYPGTSGTYSWDGIMDDRTPAPAGIYVIFMECLGTDGKYHRYKKACVLAGRTAY